MRSARRQGEYIHIHWSDYHPRGEYVRGHVEDDPARATLAREGLAPTGAVRWTWARWTPDSTGEYDCWFNVVEAGGPGCFKVTEVAYAH